MKQIKVKAKKWGNSIGFILPKETLEKEEIKEGSEIVVTVQPKKVSTVGDLMELLKKMNLRKSKESVQEIMNEIDKDLWGIER